MLRTIHAATLAALVLLALPAAAGATVFNVNSAAALTAALDVADSSAVNDTINIAAGTYDGPFTYAPSVVNAGRLTVAGAGGSTILTDGGGDGVVVLKLGSDVAGNPLDAHDLHVITPPAGAGTAGISTRGTMQRVLVTRSPAAVQGSYATGVRLRGQSTLRDSEVRFGTVDRAVSVDPGVGGDPEALIEDSVVEGSVAIFASEPVHVTRTRVRARYEGIVNCVSTVRVDNVLVELTGDNSTGLEAHSAQCGGLTEGATTNARHVTIHDPLGTQYTRAITCSAGYAATTVELNVAASIATGFRKPLELAGPGTCAIRVRESDMSLTPSDTGTGPGTVVDQGGNIVADPGYLDAVASDYRLRPGSPAIDTGGGQPLDSLIESLIDLGGGARLIDGNGDGVLRRDMGAYEAPTTVPAPPSPTPVGGGAPPAPGGSSAPSSGAAPDRTAPGLSGARLAPRAFTRRRGSVLRFRLSESATISAVIERARPGRRVGGRCRSGRRGARCTRYVKVGTPTFAGEAGANTARFTPGTLAPGRYRLRLQARDVAGNRSAEVRLGFRVKRR